MKQALKIILLILIINYIICDENKTIPNFKKLNTESDFNSEGMEIPPVYTETDEEYINRLWREKVKINFNNEELYTLSWTKHPKADFYVIYEYVDNDNKIFLEKIMTNQEKLTYVYNNNSLIIGAYSSTECLTSFNTTHNKPKTNK